MVCQQTKAPPTALLQARETFVLKNKHTNCCHAETIVHLVVTRRCLRGIIHVRVDLQRLL